MKAKHFYVKRGDLCVVKLYNPDEHIQTGERPCIVVQNDIGNIYSSTTIVVPVTSQLKKLTIPAHIPFERRNGRHCVALCEQIATINKNDICWFMEHLPEDVMSEVDRGLIASVFSVKRRDELNGKR